MGQTLLAALLVAVGGALGAPARYVIDLVAQSVHDTVFPWGTLTVNLAGSLLLGVVAAAVAQGAPGWVLTLVGTGVCGALTTFSTLGYETLRLLEDGAWLEAGSNAAASLLLGLVACTGGYALTAALG